LPGCDARCRCARSSATANAGENPSLPGRSAPAASLPRGPAHPGARLPSLPLLQPTAFASLRLPPPCAGPAPGSPPGLGSPSSVGSPPRPKSKDHTATRPGPIRVAVGKCGGFGSHPAASRIKDKARAGQPTNLGRISPAETTGRSAPGKCASRHSGFVLECECPTGHRPVSAGVQSHHGHQPDPNKIKGPTQSLELSLNVKGTYGHCWTPAHGDVVRVIRGDAALRGVRSRFRENPVAVLQLLYPETTIVEWLLP
jgi:hypothetical protein